MIWTAVETETCRGLASEVKRYRGLRGVLLDVAGVFAL